MIKIIERGTRTITECENCGCRFSYEKEDIRGENGPGMAINFREYITCPQCNKEIGLKATR